MGRESSEKEAPAGAGANGPAVPDLIDDTARLDILESPSRSDGKTPGTPVDKVEVRRDETWTVLHQRARAAKDQGEAKLAVLHAGFPTNVRAEIHALIRDAAVDPKQAAQARRAKITQLMLHSDPDIAFNAIAASQKEDGLDRANTINVAAAGFQLAVPADLSAIEAALDEDARLVKSTPANNIPAPDDEST